MTKQILIAAATAALALPAVASAQGILFTIDPSDGSTVLTGTGSLQGLQVESPAGVILNDNLPVLGGFSPVITGYNADGALITQPGPGALGLGQLINLPTDVAFGNVNGPFYDFDANGPVILGEMFDVDMLSMADGVAGLSQDDLDTELVGRSTFRVGDSSIDGQAAFALVPEPATAGVVGLAAVGFLARRRRA